jgi:hypothetical protein
MTGGIYTWSNNQKPPTLEKLDRFLMSREWEIIFPRAMVRKMQREMSDHNPLIISTEPNGTLKHLEFKFELTWINHPNFKSHVVDIWGKPYYATTAFDRIQQKMKRFKQYFKGWGFNQQGVQRKLKQAI